MSVRNGSLLNYIWEKKKVNLQEKITIILQLVILGRPNSNVLGNNSPLIHSEFNFDESPIES